MPYVVEEAYKNYKDEAKFLKKENDGKIELISLKEKQVHFSSSVYTFFLFHLLDYHIHMLPIKIKC